MRSAAPGRELGAAMTRPRLSYNVAVYHRSFDGPPRSSRSGLPGAWSGPIGIGW